jgi:hypothetical protein
VILEDARFLAKALRQLVVGNQKVIAEYFVDERHERRGQS